MLVVEVVYLVVSENDVNKWQKKYMEAERDLKEHERALEKIPSGKSMWSSSSNKYVYGTPKGLFCDSI